jgi:Domain of unknown function (DUF4190)
MSNGYTDRMHGTMTPTHRGGAGVAAIVLGIIAVVLSWWWPAGLVLGVIAVVCGVVGRHRVARGEAGNRGTATAGLTLGIVGLVLTAGFFAFILAAGS